MKNSGFNPKARWDKHIPNAGTQEKRDPQEINEQIDVVALFKNAKIYPKAFFWKNKTYKIKEITYNWQQRCGQAIINYFSVNTDPDLYQLSFNSSSLGWKIDKTIE